MLLLLVYIQSGYIFPSHSTTNKLCLSVYIYTRIYDVYIIISGKKEYCERRQQHTHLSLYVHGYIIRLVFI